VKERVLRNRVGITEDAWEQAPNDIEEHHGWKLPPCKDIIANGYLGVYIRLHARIHTAIASTDEE
jgi:hypothetical protein